MVGMLQVYEYPRWPHFAVPRNRITNNILTRTNIVQSVETRTAQFPASETVEHRWHLALPMLTVPLRHGTVQHSEGWRVQQLHLKPASAVNSSD